MIAFDRDFRRAVKSVRRQLADDPSVLNSSRDLTTQIIDLLDEASRNEGIAPGRGLLRDEAEKIVLNPPRSRRKRNSRVKSCLIPMIIAGGLGLIAGKYGR